MLDASQLSKPALEALRKFGVFAARYHAAKKKKMKVHFRYSASIQEVYCPRSIQTDYIDANIALKSFDELKDISDSIDSERRLDALEATRHLPGAEERDAQSYADLVRVELEIVRLAVTL